LFAITNQEPGEKAPNQRLLKKVTIDQTNHQETLSRDVAFFEKKD
jgi:hypothetical protein